jgi:hypothetical protein
MPAQGSISGVVRDDATGAPLPDAQIAAIRPPLQTVTVRADAEGRYVVRGLDAGSYRIFVSVPPPSGTGIGSTASRPVTLAADQELTGIDVRVRVRGVLSGKVIDENHEPLPDIRVFLVAREYSSGAVQYVFAGAARTDDRGNYSLRAEPRRAFLLLAVKHELKLPAISDAPDDPKLRRPVPLPTYYPDSGTPEGAQPLVLRPGEQRENIDIRMSKGPSYCIEATLDGASDLRFEIAMRRPASGASGNGAFYTAIPGGEAGPDGKIRICDLHPGEYELTAAHWTPARQYAPDAFSSTIVTVVDRDLPNVRLSARPRIPVPGEIVWDGAPPEKPVEGEVTIQLRSLTRTIYESTKCGVPGQFSFPGLLADEYSVQFRDLPPSLYIKDIAYAGYSILGKPLPAGSAMGGAGLRVIVARDGATVRARVTDKDGNATGNGHVTLLAANAASEVALAAAMHSGQTDQNGIWTSGALAPGKYYAFATHHAIDRSPESIGKVWRSRSQAYELDLAPGVSANIILESREIE